MGVGRWALGAQAAVGPAKAAWAVLPQPLAIVGLQFAGGSLMLRFQQRLALNYTSGCRALVLVLRLPLLLLMQASC